MSIRENYSQKLQQLFDLGKDNLNSSENYYSKFGFTKEDISELIKLATDTSYYDMKEGDEEEKLFFATIHSIYILAHLKATEAIKPLVTLMDNECKDSEYYNETMMDFFDTLGMQSYEELSDYLLNYSNTSGDYLCEAIKKMAKTDEDKERVSILMIDFLQKDHQSFTNASAISTIVDTTEDKHIDFIRECFKTKEIDTMLRGDIEDIEIDLGLREERESERPNKNPFEEMINNFEKEYNISKDEIEEDEVKKETKKIGRNEPCPCGSGKKYKKCCLNR